MPCNDCSRAETCPPCVNETEPQGSDDSSLNERCKNCNHRRRNHRQGTCVVCAIAFNERHCAAFVPADAETLRQKVGRLDAADAVQRAVAETAGEPEAPEHDWTEWGAVYHGGHLRWRDCRGCGNTESTPEGHFCPECAPVCKAPNGCHTPGACKESCAFEDQLKGIRLVPRAEPEPEAPACDHRCSCGHDQQDHSTSGYCNACSDQCEDDDGHYPDGCPQAPVPETPVCTHNSWDEGFMRCQDCGFEPESPGSPAPPRPPILVAYATGSGDLNELALPGDATAAVVDGSLVISHASGVLGIVHVKPMELET